MQPCTWKFNLYLLQLNAWAGGEVVAYGGVARMWVIVGELDLIESRGKWQAIKTPSSHTVTERD